MPQTGAVRGGFVCTAGGRFGAAIASEPAIDELHSRARIVLKAKVNVMLNAISVRELFELSQKEDKDMLHAEARRLFILKCQSMLDALAPTELSALAEEAGADELHSRARKILKAKRNVTLNALRSRRLDELHTLFTSQKDKLLLELISQVIGEKERAELNQKTMSDLQKRTVEELMTLCKRSPTRKNGAGFNWY